MLNKCLQCAPPSAAEIPRLRDATELNNDGMIKLSISKHTHFEIITKQPNGASNRKSSNGNAPRPSTLPVVESVTTPDV